MRQHVSLQQRRPGSAPAGRLRYENAYIESFWSSLKYELVYQHRFSTRAEARWAIFDYIEIFYNRTKLRSGLGYVSPATFETKLD